MKGEKSRLGHLLRIFHFAMNGPGSNFFPVDTDCCLSFCCLSFFFSFPCLVVPTSRQGGGFCAAFFWGDCTPSPLWYQATKQPSNRQRGRASLSLSLSFLWCPLWGGLGCTSLVPFTQAWYPSSKQPGNRQRGRPSPPTLVFPFSLFSSLCALGEGVGVRSTTTQVGAPALACTISQSVSPAGRRAGGHQPVHALSLVPLPLPLPLLLLRLVCFLANRPSRHPLRPSRHASFQKREGKKETTTLPPCRHHRHHRRHLNHLRTTASGLHPPARLLWTGDPSAEEREKGRKGTKTRGGGSEKGRPESQPAQAGDADPPTPPLPFPAPPLWQDRDAGQGRGRERHITKAMSGGAKRRGWRGAGGVTHGGATRRFAGPIEEAHGDVCCS